MRVLGIDPGTIRCGWGVVDFDASRLRYVASGTVDAGRGEIASRLAAVYSQLGRVIVEHRPDEVGLERSFVARNVQSAFRLGEARGVAMAVAAAAGLPVVEYTPMMIKKAVAGYGRAEKGQVQKAVATLLAFDGEPQSDEADALAAALCHALSGRYEARVGEALALRGLRRGRGRSWRSVRG